MKTGPQPINTCTSTVYHPLSHLYILKVSEWLLLNANSAIFQLDIFVTFQYVYFSWTNTICISELKHYYKGKQWWTTSSPITTMWTRSYQTHKQNNVHNFPKELSPLGLKNTRQNDWSLVLYSQTCIKRTSLGQVEIGLIRQVTS